jgi:hypothetical protein
MASLLAYRIFCAYDCKDHPELYITPELDENGIKQYQQSLIGALQWLVTLGHLTALLLSPLCLAIALLQEKVISNILSGSLGLSRNTLMVPSVSDQIFLTMKDITLVKNLIGVLLSMVMSKRMYLMICLSLKARLCVPQHTTM